MGIGALSPLVGGGKAVEHDIVVDPSHLKLVLASPVVSLSGKLKTHHPKPPFPRRIGSPMVMPIFSI